MVFVVAPEVADAVLAELRAHPLGRDAAIIGRADGRAGLVRIKTPIAGERILDVPYGEELPRIC